MSHKILKNCKLSWCEPTTPLADDGSIAIAKTTNEKDKYILWIQSLKQFKEMNHVKTLIGASSTTMTINRKEGNEKKNLPTEAAPDT